MFKKLGYFFRSYSFVSFPMSEKTRVYDYCYKSGISFEEKRGKAEKKEDERERIKLTCRASDILAAELEREGIEYSISRTYGLLSLGEFFLCRPILALSAVVFAAWIIYSTRIIWDVRIEGNSKTDEGEIIALLDELGCGVGDYFPSIDFNQLHASYMARQGDIAWLSVFMHGTVAEVQVRELWRDERKMREEGVYANIVSDCYAVVNEVNVFEGQAAVTRGDIVSPGQVLISGVIEHSDGSVRYEYASGEVKCTTVERIDIETSTEREVKRYTGREKTLGGIKFFKKPINFFGNCGIEYTTYDKIYIVEQLCPLGFGEIPVWSEKTVFREYEMISETVLPEKAADESVAELSRELARISVLGEITQKKIETSFDGTVYKIGCLVYLEREVGVTEEFSAEIQNTEK